uniref:non-specific serine/threonine protein kinase n=1 Tax=Fagus sylvatica TaxID=28930 RepID=A0A2N9H2C4_FAGSY
MSQQVQLVNYYFLILSLFFFINYLGTNSSPLFSTCPWRNCGNVNIGYPFWLRNETTSDQHYCGYPGFGLTCLNDEETVLALPAGDHRYYVKAIDYSDYTLTLVDFDARHATNQSCPRARHNVTLGELPLKFSLLDLNLSFYFNCTTYPPLVPYIECLGFDARRSYVFVEGNETEGFDWSENCEDKVVVAVMNAVINIGNLISGFAREMNDGFVLDWGEGPRIAVHVRTLEGMCGYNDTAKEFLCFCNDGSTRSNSCKGMLSSSF